MENKDQIRKHMLKLRHELSADTQKQACESISAKLLSLLPPAGAVIGGYLPVRSEADLTQAMRAVHEKHYSIAMPTVAKSEKTMIFIRWSPDSPLKQGAFGILEPAHGETLIPDMLWVPLVGFDRQRHRIGYGGGYYDTTIAHLKKQKRSLIAIGIGYSVQEIRSLPAEAHDMQLDMIVTEKEIIRP